MEYTTEDFPRRVRLWRHTLGLTQTEAAQRLGVERSYLSQLEGSRKPGEATRIRFEIEEQKAGLGPGPNPAGLRVLETPEEEYRAAAASALYRAQSRVRALPVLSWAQAGLATDFQQMPEEWEGSVASEVKDDRSFAVRLRGDSMEPRFEDGDIAVLLPSVAATNGEIVVANLKNEGILCKIMHVQLDKNLITLSSYNPAYPPMQYRREDFHWIFPVAQIVKNLRRK
jgi:SOS-response transcriptional repressor LexA